jgi:hypothetical protein
MPGDVRLSLTLGLCGKVTAHDPSDVLLPLGKSDAIKHIK